MIKRFLVPVLALAAFGVPAGASIVTYCDSGCGANTMSVFNSLTSGDTFASGSPITFGPALGVLSGGNYTDDLTSVLFQATHNLTDPGALDTQNGAGDALSITVQSNFSALLVALTSQSGIAGFYLDSSQNNITNLGSTPTTVGYINSNPTGPWTITISKLGGANSVAVNNFNAAGGAQTPEVGTLLLIGAGLISMRWMKRLPKPRFFRTPQTASSLAPVLSR